MPISHHQHNDEEVTGYSRKVQTTEQMEGGNQTPIMELILLGLGNGPELQPLLFVLFLVIYLVAVAGNLLIIVLVVTDPHLHTPMYYFVVGLSGVEIFYVSTTLSWLLASLATGDRTISLQNCFVQYFLYIILANAESLLLTAMCCDRYLAICHPLRYAALMNIQICCHMIAGSWIISILYCFTFHMFILQFRYCGPKEIDLFFCDFAVLSEPFCGADIQTMHLVAFLVTVILTVVVFLFILTTYICIIANILRISSSTGRQKAFSTCSSHLIMVAGYYVSSIIVYVVTLFNPPVILYKILSVWFAILIPVLNPVLYCLRNKDAHKALRDGLLKLAAFRHRPEV
ncbi:olfactory receptor 7A42-like [Pelodiscus sinensis]|uniref:olfactory receptor 7A42-like n=1 Tax=Pelodiscus sinensis TaxID=13735 RepID=UPI003F6D7D65